MHRQDKQLLDNGVEKIDDDTWVVDIAIPISQPQLLDLVDEPNVVVVVWRMVHDYPQVSQELV